MGGKSQYAMQNISEGGLEGLNAYQEGIRTSDAARKALTQSEMLMAQAQRAERQGARKDAVQLTHQAEQAKQTAVQLSNSARQIMGTEAFQQGQTEVSLRNAATAEQNALTSGRMADAAMVTAEANRARANALGANAGTKGALTEAQLARVRDTARDNVTKDANFMLNQLKAEAAAKKAGKPFDAATWQASLVDAEVERLLANTSRGAKIPTPEAAPTGGKLGSGTYNPELWKNLQVVTPK